MLDGLLVILYFALCMVAVVGTAGVFVLFDEMIRGVDDICDIEFDMGSF